MKKIYLLVVSLLMSTMFLQAQVNLTAASNTYTQDFNTLASTGATQTWTDNTTLLGWYAANNTGAQTTLTLGTGTGTTGGHYNFGATSATDRAIGMLTSGTTPQTTQYTALRIKNNDATQRISAITITYTGEQWRTSGVAGTMDFQYGVGATGVTTGTYVFGTSGYSTTALDFVAPSIATAGALDGNLAANRAVKTATLNLMVLPGQEIWLRWRRNTSSSPGLAVDDVNISATYCTPQPTCSYCNFNLGGSSTTGISRVQFNSLDNTSGATVPTAVGIGYYASFAPTGAATTSVVAGVSYNMTVTSSSATTIVASVWFDFNQNGTFETTEYFPVFTTSGTSGTASITIPAGSNTGSIPMRVRSRGSGITSADACTNFASGECEDYVITVTAPVACSATPPAASISSSSSLVCSNTNFTITPTGTSTETGITYQWQSSAVGAGSWSNVGAATATPQVLTTALTTGSLDYRLVSTCTSVSASSNSNVVTVNLSTATYATIPYAQSFEGNWVNTCGTKDVPDNSWRNTPVTTDSSWRRDDDGTSAAWGSPGSYIYSPTGSDGSRSARFHSGNVSILSGPKRGKLDLYVNGSTQPAAGFGLSFDYINTSGTDSLSILYSTDGGVSFTRLDSITLRSVWTNKQITIPTNAATTVIRFQAWADFGTTDIGIDNVNVAPLCNTTPTVGTASSTPTVACTGANVALNLTGGSTDVGLTYQWQSTSIGGGTWTNIAGATSKNANFAFVSPVDVRCIVTCAATSQSANSATITVNGNIGTYTSIAGFTESFETAWVNACGTSDAANSAWRNAVATGNNSWRRNDDAASAAWTSATSGGYTPTFSAGAFSARFHSWSATSGSTGSMDLFLDASSAAAAGFGLSYDYINTSGTDVLAVLYSTDGGATFTQVGSNNGVAATWTNRQVLIPTNSPTVIVRFRATSDGGLTDIGLDNIQVVPLCSGQPNAGTATTTAAAVCSGAVATSINATGVSTNAGVTYQWKEASVAGGPYTNVSGATTVAYSLGSLTNITSSPIVRYFVLESTCAGSGQTNLSSEVSVTINPIPTVAVSPNVTTTICSASPQTFTATPGNITTTATYQWKLTGTNIAGATNATYAANAAGFYTVLVTDQGTGCSFTSTPSVQLIVNASPNAPVITPAAPTICAGSVQALTSSSIFFTENFDGTTNSMVVTTPTVTGAALADQPWNLRTSTYVYSATNFSSGATGNKFMMANSDIGASGSTVTTQLTSPNINTVGATALQISFRHYFRNISPSTGKVQYSIDGGGTWVTATTYSASTLGTSTAFANAIVSLPASTLGLTNLKIRFEYFGSFSYYWAVDDVKVEVPGAVIVPTWSPLTDLFTDAAATVPYTGTAAAVVYAKPSTSATYSATATSGTCFTSTNVSVTVNPALPASVSIATDATSICAGTNVTFTATPTNGGTTPSYQWKVNGTNVGTNSATYASTTLANNDVVSVLMTSNATPCLTGSPATSNNVTITVNAASPASVSIAADATSICAGTTVTFTATPTNGGTTPAYQWKVNGVDVGTNSATYASTTLVNNDVVTVVMTSNATPCLTGSPATSNSVTMTVNAALPASVSIAADATIICFGTNVTFTATPNNGGITPAYQWKLNGANVGTNSNIYSSATLANNDVVTVVMTSNAACASGSPATSNAVTMTVNPFILASVTIAADATTICAGTNVTFTATPNNGGTTPAYQWKLNGANVGTNSATYASTTLANNDVVTVVMTSSATACLTGSPATSNSVTITVNAPLPASVNIVADATTICVGTNVTFTATPTNGGTTPAYQWKVNGTDVGTNSATYASTSLANNDVVTVVMTSNATCVSGSPATSNTITMTVNAASPASVSIAADVNNVCSGTSITFTATPTNGGTTPTYQWKVNGTDVPAATATTYSSSALANNDVVTVVMTSNAACVSGSPATSNAITVTVNAGATIPTLAVNNNPICVGETMIFTASGGQLYEFFVNGTSTGAASAANTYSSSTLAAGDVVTVNNLSDLVMNGTIEAIWGTALATSAGGPSSGFGAANQLNALYANANSANINIAIAGTVNNGNRIVLYIDSKTGGYTDGSFGRASAPAGVANFNSGTTFDAGFAADYALVIGTEPTNSNYFYDLYTLSAAGGPNNYLGDNTNNLLGTYHGSAPGATSTTGFEIAIPKSLLGYTTGDVKVMGMLMSDGGFLSNQFLTRAGSGDGNYGSGAVNFGAATPDPVTLSAALVNGSCPASSNAITVAYNPGGLWKGTVSSDWNNPANWCGGVPTSATSVTIPNGTPNYPNVSSSSPAATALRVTVANNASLTVSTGGLLTLNPATGPFSNSTFNGQLNITGGEFDISGNTLIINNQLNMTGGSLASSATNPAALTINSGVNVSNLTFSASNNTLRGITMDMQSGSNQVTLGSPVTITQFVAFNYGKIVTSATNLLTLNATASVPFASDLSYVEGPVARKTIVGSNYTLPTGKNGHYRPAIVQPVGVIPSTYTAEYFETGTVNNTSIQTPAFVSIVSNNYWDISRAAGSEDAKVKLPFNNSLDAWVTAAPTTASQITIAHYNGTLWNSEYSATVGDAIAGNSTTGLVTSRLVNNFSPFTFGYGTIGVLPIDLIDVRADKLSNTTAQVRWTTAPTSTATYFEVMKSTDGVNFSKLSTVLANNTNAYSLLDNNMTNGVNYYRLRMVDRNGAITTSKTVVVLNKFDGITLASMTPTLVTSNAFVNVVSSKKEKMQLVVTDVRGRVLMTQSYGLEVGINNLNVQLSTLANGSYQMTAVANDGTRQTFKFVKQ